MLVINSTIPRSIQGTEAVLRAATGLPATVYVKKHGTPDTLVLGMKCQAVAYKLGLVYFVNPENEGSLIEDRGKDNIAALQNGSVQLATKLENVVRCGCDDQQAIIVLMHDTRTKLHKIIKQHRVRPDALRKKNLAEYAAYDDLFRSIHKLPPFELQEKDTTDMTTLITQEPTAQPTAMIPGVPPVPARPANEEVRPRTPGQYRDLFNTYSGYPVLVYKLRMAKTPLLGLAAKTLGYYDQYLIFRGVTQHGFFTNTLGADSQTSLEQGSTVVMAKLGEVNRAGVVNGVVEVYLKCEAMPDTSVTCSDQWFQRYLDTAASGVQPSQSEPDPTPVVETSPPATPVPPQVFDAPIELTLAERGQLWVNDYAWRTLKFKFADQEIAYLALVVPHVAMHGTVVVELYMVEGPMVGKLTSLTAEECGGLYKQPIAPVVVPAPLKPGFFTRTGAECVMQMHSRCPDGANEYKVEVHSLGKDGGLSMGSLVGLALRSGVQHPDVLAIRRSDTRVGVVRSSDIIVGAGSKVVVTSAANLYSAVMRQEHRKLSVDEVRTRLRPMQAIVISRLGEVLPGYGTVVGIRNSHFEVVMPEQGRFVRLIIRYDAVLCVDVRAPATIQLCDDVPIGIVSGGGWHPDRPVIRVPVNLDGNATAESVLYRRNPNGTGVYVGNAEYLGVTQGMAVFKNYRPENLPAAAPRIIGIKSNDIVWASAACQVGGTFLIKQGCQFVDLKQNPGTDALDVALVTLEDVKAQYKDTPPEVPAAVATPGASAPPTPVNVEAEALKFWTNLMMIGNQITQAEQAIVAERLRLQKEKDLLNLSIDQLNQVRKNVVDVWHALASLGNQRALPVYGSGPELSADHPLVVRHNQLIAEGDALLDAVSPEVFAEASKHYSAQFAQPAGQPAAQLGPKVAWQPPTVKK